MKQSLEMKEALHKLGGHFCPEWVQECTHLVMESLVLTIKAVSALLSARYIVQPGYITDLLESFRTKKRKPDPNNYLPILKESSLSNTDISFAPDEIRSRLFADKTFIFHDAKMMKKLQFCIKAAGIFIFIFEFMSLY